jgi:hypothetical protein
MSTTARLILKEVSTLQLRLLLGECKLISSSIAPAHARVSVLMRQLLAAEKTSYSYWFEQFSTVSREIELEILHRFAVDTLN